MNRNFYPEQIVCGYLYPITLYGYPPDVRQTAKHIDEMVEMGFRSIELEGIGEKNIRYLFQHRALLADKIAAANCIVPVLCIVLPGLASVHASKRSESLELFEMGCELAHKIGSSAVLDNGPLLPLEYPADGPIRRHYREDQLKALALPPHFSWQDYWLSLTATYHKACLIAAKFGLDYHLHPCEGSLITTTDSFINFASAVNSPNLLFNLDTANQFYFRDNLSLSVLRLAERISYIHISDNTGSKVEHLVPGDGHIRWDRLFEALRDIGFRGKFGIDVGGSESGIENITGAYIRTSGWLSEQLDRYSLNLN